MQPFCQNPALSRSLESELESAVKSGELKLSSKNLKDFPRHGERFNLSDTTLAGKNTLALLSVGKTLAGVRNYNTLHTSCQFCTFIFHLIIHAFLHS